MMDECGGAPDSSYRGLPSSHRSGRLEELKALSAELGVEFRQWDLLDRAFTHASRSAEHPESKYDYEALEFVGDAVLGLAVSHYLYDAVPERTPGEYSRLRAGVVNRRSLARIAGDLGIASAIRLGKGEELAGGRHRASLLADCFEALIGALYLDRDWETARAFVQRVFAPEIERELASGRIWDFKSRLQTYAQARHWPLPVFTVVHSEGPDHRKQFEIEVVVDGRPMGRGRGARKKDAEQGAAREALERLGAAIGPPDPDTPRAPRE